MFENRKYSVLVVSSSEKMNEAFKNILPLTKYRSVTFAGSISAAKRNMLDSFYDFVIINTPLSDDFGTDFAVELCRKKSCVCMLIVKSELYEKISHRVIPYGVFTLPKPTSTANMEVALSWLASANPPCKINDIRVFMFFTGSVSKNSNSNPGMLSTYNGSAIIIS